MRRILSLLLILCLLLPAALAEESPALRAAATVEDVRSFIDLPEGDAFPAAAKGRIRFVSMNARDAAFCTDAWKNDRFDLTQKGSYRADYRNMHDRAVYCMAPSYLGVDVTPAMMSSLADSRDVSAPFDNVTAQLPRVERVEFKAYHFDTAVENYRNDDSYSPVFVKIKRPDGALHTVMVVGYIPSTGGFIICDPEARVLDGENQYAYKMAWHVVRQVVLASDFWDLFYASQVQAVYQWRLFED